MKKIILIAICFFGAQLQAQEVLFTVGNQTVTAEEFQAVYEKNKGVGNAIDPKTPEEYLDLYVRFKLKIAEAFNQQRDTAGKFVKEFGGYRAQLAKPYLSDAGSEDALIKEAYGRMSQEVRAAHIMFELASSALPSDTMRVYKAMMELRDESVKAASVMSVANVSAAKVSDKDVVPKDRVKLYPAGRRILLTKKLTRENF